MVTVSDKLSVKVAAALLLSVAVCSCNSVIPVKQQVNREADSNGVVANNRLPAQASADKFLPLQEYNAAGEKIAYVPQPNPYTTDISTVPAEARLLFLAASARLESGDLKGAHEKFMTLTEKYPSLSGPWVKLGAIAEAQDNYTDAMKHYQKAISVNRNNVNAYMALGLVQRRQGKFSDAFHTYIDALSAWRDFPEAHLNLAILYDLYLNNAEEAQKHYEAYYFLTGEKDEKVQKWLVEVKHRTGIDRSFIDIPPAKVAGIADSKPGSAVAVAVTKATK